MVAAGNIKYDALSKILGLELETFWAEVSTQPNEQHVFPSVSKENRGMQH